MNNTSEITDAPTIRSLKFALQDEFEDWRDGELMLQSLITTPDDVRRNQLADARAEVLREFFRSKGMQVPERPDRSGL